jgi:hypothetical protein
LAGNPRAGQDFFMPEQQVQLAQAALGVVDWTVTGAF